MNKKIHHLAAQIDAIQDASMLSKIAPAEQSLVLILAILVEQQATIDAINEKMKGENHGKA